MLYEFPKGFFDSVIQLHRMKFSLELETLLESIWEVGVDLYCTGKARQVVASKKNLLCSPAKQYQSGPMTFVKALPH